MQQRNYIANLGVLIAVFVVGFISLMGIHLYFDEYIEEKFDAQIDNEMMRYRIGELIIARIGSVESHYYKLATLGEQIGIARIRKDILHETDVIRQLLNVLENGGSIEIEAGLNLPDIEAIKEVITYKKAENAGFSMEFIDLFPKINSLEVKVDELASFIKNREAKVNTLQTEQEIVIFLKQLPTHFIRMKENAGRLLYDSRQKMMAVKSESEKQKQFYMMMQYVIALCVLILITFLGTFLARGILKTNEKLLKSNEKANALAIKAQTADHAKSLFLANMSHEIRTPLNGIIGFSNILTQSAITPQNREYARIIYENSHALLDIINDILDLSKVEQGTIELTEEPFEVMSVIERVVELFAIKAKEKAIRFYFYASPTIPERLVGDGVRLRQVLSNLVGNAIKFTPEGGKVHFEVRQLSIDNEVCLLRCLIKDTGIGISQEQQQKIFEPFTQADEGISRQFGGTGLGLSISLDILKKMGSDIKLQSQMGKGSTFFFDIEFKIAECTIQATPKQFPHRFAIVGEPTEMPELLEVLQVYLHKWGHLQAWDKTKPVEALFCFIATEGLGEGLKAYKQLYPSTLIIGLKDNCLEPLPLALEPYMDQVLDCPLFGSKIFNAIVSLFKEEADVSVSAVSMAPLNKTVMVAEDNPTNRHLMKVYLDKLGVTCRMAENGLEAVELYKKESFDAILMDINMPIMDGIVATQTILEEEKKTHRTHIPIVALTANTLKGDKERYLTMGMDGHLSKPIDFNELRYFLETLTPAKHWHTVQEEPMVETGQHEEGKALLPSISKEDIAQKMGLDVMTVEMILDNFFLTLEDDLCALEAACASGNAEAIRQKAHYLKGACANLFLEEATALLAAIEENPLEKSGDAPRVRACLQAIQ